MDTLLPIARRIAERLIVRRETIAVAEGSSGGLIAAAPLAIPGASAYFLGGAVVYTAAARAALLGVSSAEMAGMRAATEPYAAMLAKPHARASGSGRHGGLPKPVQPGRRATAMAILPDIPASQWRAPRTEHTRCGPASQSRIQHARVLRPRACAAGRGDRGLRSETTAFCYRVLPGNAAS